MNCPHCSKPLEKRIYEGNVEIDGCSSCRGMWLDQGELERIQSTVEHDYTERLKKPANTVAQSFEMAKQRSRPAIQCPKCERSMIKKESGMCSGVMVDKCPSCSGLWLDDGEVQQLEVFFERMRHETSAQDQQDIETGFFASLWDTF